MEKDPAMWSRTFARRIGALLGFAAPEVEMGETAIQIQAETVLAEITEDFRYLPLAQWKWVEHFTRFLGGQETPVPVPSLEKLREVRSYLAFLRSSHGYDQPADEDDEWSDEDLQEFSNETLRRLDESDPYEWPGLPNGLEGK